MRLPYGSLLFGHIIVAFFAVVKIGGGFFKHFTAGKASWPPASPRRAARAHGGWTVGRSDAGDGWGGIAFPFFAENLPVSS